MSIMRLDKFLAENGIGTRSAVKGIIKAGRVMVDNNKVIKCEQKIDTNKNIVCLDGKEIFYEEYVYYMLNKPTDVVSAVSDKEYKTVIDLLKSEDNKKGIFPMGRLDKDTVGLLILTNNGKLSHNTLSPKKHVVKRYFVKVAGRLTEEDVKHFKNGIEIGKIKFKSAVLEIIDSGEISSAFVEISEGKFHQIKKMFYKLGKDVIYLKRVAFGDIMLDESLKEGEYRKLNNEEIKKLSAYMGE